MPIGRIQLKHGLESSADFNTMLQAEAYYATDTERLMIANGDGTGLILPSKNEIDTKIGDLTSLTTTEKGSIVGAVNEIDNNLNLVQENFLYEDISNLFTFSGTPDYAFVKKRKFDSQIFFRFNLKELTGNANSPITAATSTVSSTPPGITFSCIVTSSDGWPKGLAVGFLSSTTLRIIPSVNVVSGDSIRTGKNI